MQLVNVRTACILYTIQLVLYSYVPLINLHFAHHILFLRKQRYANCLCLLGGMHVPSPVSLKLNP